MKLYALFAALALTTFLPRFLPMALWRNRNLPDGARTLLGYVPPAVLAAVFVPGIVAPEGAISYDVLSPYLLGGVATFALMRVTKKLLLSVTIGIAVFYAVMWWRHML